MPSSITSARWWGRRDSNPHEFPHPGLGRTRMPFRHVPIGPPAGGVEPPQSRPIIGATHGKALHDFHNVRSDLMQNGRRITDCLRAADLVPRGGFEPTGWAL